MNVYEYGISLGATLESGINWNWFVGFPSLETAEQFVAFLDAHGFEHRGIYSMNETWDVRFR